MLEVTADISSKTCCSTLVAHFPSWAQAGGGVLARPARRLSDSAASVAESRLPNLSASGVHTLLRSFLSYFKNAFSSYRIGGRNRSAPLPRTHAPTVFSPVFVVTSTSVNLPSMNVSYGDRSPNSFQYGRR